MDYGIKISKRGYDAIDKAIKPSGELVTDATTLPHLLYAVALPYLKGAGLQITRYEQAARNLSEEDASNSVMACLHEASGLFEDLATIAKYMDKCDQQNDKNVLWINIRNHIRHDFRENFDDENHREKTKRAELLKMNPALQTNLGFSEEAIAVGGITVTLAEVREYLVWTGNIIMDTMKDARKKGYVSSSPAGSA